MEAMYVAWVLLWSLAAAPLLLAAPLPAFIARVREVRGPDSMVVRTASGTEHTIWLVGLYGPVDGQAGRKESRQALRRLALDRTVLVKPVADLVNGMIPSQVHQDTIWINHAMLEQGLAWYRGGRFSSPELERSHRQAFQARRGLFARPGAVPPWEWRPGVAARSPVVQSPDLDDGRRQLLEREARIQAAVTELTRPRLVQPVAAGPTATPARSGPAPVPVFDYSRSFRPLRELADPRSRTLVMVTSPG